MKPLTLSLDWRPPPLATQRLTMRAFEHADASSLFPHASNPNVTRFTLWDHHKSIDETEMFVRDYARCRYFEGSPEPYAITLKSDPSGCPIGAVGCFWASVPNQTMELGYWLGEPFWGQGLVVEACNAVLDYAFRECRPARIQARVIEGNIASMRVLAKLGFQNEGTLRSFLFRRGRLEDITLFSILPREWLAR